MYASKKAIHLLTLLTFVFSGLASAGDKEPPKEIDGMLMKEDSEVDLAYVRPDVDWKKFDSIYIRELKVTDEAKDATPQNERKGRGHMRESWLIPEEDITLMKTEFARILKETLEEDGHKVTTDVTAKTLVLVPTIVDIYLTAPIEESRDTFSSRGGTFTDGAGSMTLTAIFADGTDLHVLAYAIDNKYPSTMWARNTRVRNMSDMRRIFKYWGNNLSEALEKVTK